MKNTEWLFAIPIFLFCLVWLLSTCGLSTFASDVSKVMKFLAVLFLPGFYIAIALKKILGLGFCELFTFSMIISVAIDTLVGTYLSFLSVKIEETSIFLALFVTMLSCCCFYLFGTRTDQKQTKNMSFYAPVLGVVGLMISFVIGFFFVSRILPPTYWIGWDPWVNQAVGTTILDEGLNPFQLSDAYTDVWNVGVAGFYYFISVIKGFTGVSFYSITRFGGPMIGGAVGCVMYTLVKRLASKSIGIISSFLLVANPYFIHRFSMTVRENLAYLLMLGIILLLVCIENTPNQQRNLSISVPVSIGILLAATMASHSLTFTIALGITLLAIVLALPYKTKTSVITELVIALFISVLLVAPFFNMTLAGFTWVTINWARFPPELALFSVLFFAGLAILVFLIARSTSKPLSIALSLNSARQLIKKKVLPALVACLLLGALYLVIYPKTFSELNYNPPITHAMFLSSGLLLAPFGVLSAYKAKEMSSPLITLSVLLLILLNFPNLNIAFPIFRLVVYSFIVFSYFGSFGLGLVHNALQKGFRKILQKLRSPKVAPRNTSSRRMQHLVSSLLLIIVSIPVILDGVASTSWSTYSYYSEQDIESALVFKERVKSNDIVVPQGWTHDLLLYVGIKNVIMNMTLLKALYLTNDLQEFSEIIRSNYPNTTFAHVFMISRWINRPNYPHPDLYFLKAVGRRQIIGMSEVYTLPISYAAHELLDKHIDLRLPDGSQWLLVNFTETLDLTKADAIAIRIMNNLGTKSFFMVLQDENGNSTERIVLSLQRGENSYFLYLDEIDSYEVDLGKISVINFCFSWYDRSEIDMVITNMQWIELQEN